MSTWDPTMQTTSGAPLRAPEDGIVASSRPTGWLALRWNAIIEGLGQKHASRLSRGRAYARGGRVRDLWLSPGLASAEVIDTEARQVSHRVNVLDDDQWKRVIQVMLGNLSFLARLLEGEMPRELVEALIDEGIHLLPGRGEIGGDCDCQDYLFPCTHLTAVHLVLADALDGDPFLLLNLRGRTRDQLLAELAGAWGERDEASSEPREDDEAPPKGDWLVSPGLPQKLHFAIEEPPAPAVGLHALGPLPGGVDLARTLSPLYEAGAQAAVNMAVEDPPEIDPDNPPAWSGDVPFEAPTQPETPAERVRRATLREGLRRKEFTEELVNLLSELEPASSQDLASRLDLPSLTVRQELIELERLGIVYRTGNTRGTRWWLG